MKVYHISDKKLPSIKLNPRIPQNYMTNNGFEDNTTERVCVSKNIDGALKAMSMNLQGKQLHVYSLDIPDSEVYKPTVKEVPDGFITKELWIKKPVVMKYEKSIDVGKAKDKEFNYKYGDNVATLYGWNFADSYSFGSRDNTRISKIQSAGASQTMLKIKYKDKQGKLSERIVEPYKLVGNDFWAYDPSKESIRRFKVKNLQSMINTNKKFDPRWPIEIGDDNMIKTSELLEYMIEKQAKLNDDVVLNPVQQRVVDNPSNSMILAHNVGSGKTLSAIAKYEKLKEQGRANKALVVVPASLRHNFAEDGVKKFTNSSYNIVGNQGEVRKGTGFMPNPNSDYNIISYEMFRKKPEEIIKNLGIDTVILDESQKGRNEGTSTTNSLKSLKGEGRNIISLTGSVVNNSIADIHPLLDVVADPKDMMQLGRNKKEFSKEYFRRNNSSKYKDVREDRRPVIGFNNRKKLKKILDKYVDYAGVDEVRDIANIPHKDVSVQKVPISKQQAKLYKKLVHENPELYKLIRQKRLETLKDDEAAKAFNSLIESRKLMNSVGSVIPGINLKESADITPKTKKLLDDMENHLKTTPDGQAILLSNLINGGTDVLEAGLKERGIEYGKFIGKGNEGVTEETRQQDVRDYKDRKKRVMLISGAGAEGLSLNDTTWEGVLDPHYNPERMNQMEARGVRAHGLMHRPKDERKVDVNRYIATMPRTLGVFKSGYRTPDEMIYEIAQNKDKQNQVLFNLLKAKKV